MSPEARDSPRTTAGAHHAEEPCQQEWERVTRELEQAFSDIGCAYLTGHGVPDHLVSKCLQARLCVGDVCVENGDIW